MTDGPRPRLLNRIDGTGNPGQLWSSSLRTVRAEAKSPPVFRVRVTDDMGPGWRAGGVDDDGLATCKE